MWYHKAMEKLQDLSTSNTETVTISGAEYKKFQILKSENAELKQQNEWAHGAAASCKKENVRFQF